MASKNANITTDAAAPHTHATTTTNEATTDATAPHTPAAAINVLKQKMLEYDWPAKDIDDLLLQKVCCCGCADKLASLYFNETGNNISKEHFVAYHLCSVTNKRLVGAFCSSEDEAGHLSVCKGCKRKDNPAKSLPMEGKKARNKK